MTLPVGFQFSQGSLQDLVDCRRRFQLRYLVELAWPAPHAEPLDQVEAAAARGNAFHGLVLRHQSGIPADRLAAIAASDEVAGATLGMWWDNYLRRALEGLPLLRHPEVNLSAPLNGYRLIAKFDLLAVEPGKRAIVVDWKTAARRPARARLAQRLQTRVYRYLAVEAAGHLNVPSGPFCPDQVEMRYWFAADPDRAERFPYDATQHTADRAYLLALIEDAATRVDYPLTANESTCRFCAYRSFCARGDSAGRLTAGDAPDDWDDIGAGEVLDLDEIGEVRF